jgi:signal transduction histidine kinase
MLVTLEFGLATGISSGESVPEPGWLFAILFLGAMVALGMRRRYPLVAIAVISGVAAAEAASVPTGQQSSFEMFFALVLGAYALGAYSASNRVLVGGVLLSAMVPIADDVRNVVQGDGLSVELFPYVIWSGAAALIGRGVRNRVIAIRVLQDHAEQLEQEREMRARAAVAEERARIARDLHDVVAHSVSVMVVQAGGARRILRSDAEAAHSTLLSLEETGREALSELRRLLGVLRIDGASLAPQPSLGDIQRLIDDMRSVGLDVTLETEGQPVELPAGAGLVGYRVVQESLTNVLKHSKASRASLRLCYRPDRVEIEVSDGGRGPVESNGIPGFGLFGMRERLALYGGSLVAGPAPGGGFLVRATIPLKEALA